MPMSFPDMRALARAAEVWDFRQPKEDEAEPVYRAALADHVQPKDIIESMEIRTGKGWDRWSTEESNEMLRRSQGGRG